LSLPTEPITAEIAIMASVTEFSDSTFQGDVLKSEVPVLVDFWAPWCGPCRAIAPVVEELARENQGTFKIGKVNIDDNPDVAMNYGVNSIPTLMIFKKGEVVDRFVGLQSKSRLQQAIDAAKA
jgi:thioredoxin 1